jgi:chorismate mutase/prephenate dehydratase
LELKDLRKQLDEIDPQIVELYERRMEICAQVADAKILSGKNVFDPVREKEKIASVKSMCHNDFNRTGAAELFDHLMSMSRKLQYQRLSEAGASGRLPFIEVDSLTEGGCRVVYQGAEGSYSQEAMFRFFGREVKNFHVNTFREAMAAIDEGSADYAVLPIENSTAGIVNEMYDLLSEYENYIVGEQIIPIEHCLIGVPGASEDDIKVVYSHAQSLMQSSEFLEKHPSWQQVSLKNNAFAVQKIASENDPSQAAIAGRHAAEYYGMNIIRERINSCQTNSTRFIIVCNRRIYVKGASRVSVIVEIGNEAGALYSLLSHFHYNHINMSGIESRPIGDRDWEYRFFIDFDGCLSDSGVKNALRGIREEARSLRILGNY